MENCNRGLATRVRAGRRLLLGAAMLVASSGVASAANVVGNSPDGLWSKLDALPAGVAEGPAFARSPVYVPLTLNLPGMKQLLSTAPMEFTAAAGRNPVVVSMPMPDGTFARFKVAETIMMEQGLRDKFPDIKTYSGVGLDDTTASLKIDITELGFRAMVWSEQGSSFIDPYTWGNTSVYTTFRKADLGQAPAFGCSTVGADRAPLRAPLDLEGDNYGASLRGYRFAFASTIEFTAATGPGFSGGNATTGLAALVNLTNRMNQSFERDLAIRLLLVANNNLLVFTTSDQYSNPSVGTMISQNVTVCNNTIGSANYDVGHVVGWVAAAGNANGVAGGIGNVCSASKAQGATIADSSQTVFLPFAIDYVIHELGHQFGGNHTWNNCSGGAGATANPASLVETGSGITIMGYAGICGSTNIASNSIDTFHTYNLINEMRPYTSTGTGGTCGSVIVTGNNIPTVSGPGNFTIPVRTPYLLTAAGSDPDGDSLTYSWEQTDAKSTITTLQTDPGSGPITRPYSPTASPIRYFPQLSVAFVNSITNLGETLPTTSRNLNFRVGARDGRGGYITATSVVSSTTTSGPFTVTAPGAGQNWTGNSNRTVTWNVANTTAAPVSCANVRIAYTTNGGTTWTDLIASTPNDGSETIVAPNISTGTLRIGVFAVGNIFWNVNTANVVVTPVVVQPCYANCDGSTDLPVLGAADFSCFLNRYRNGETYANCDGSTDVPVLGPADFACFLNQYRAGCP